MAIDRWLLDRVEMGEMEGPVLRFYQWAAPTLSLGFHQKLSSLPKGVGELDVVRRPTGGRAVLHQATGELGDLTYGIVADGLGTHRRRAYERLCQFLRRGLLDLGVEVSFGEGGRGYVGEASCFRTATAADLCWRGRKLVGSAQVWRRQVVLQHGTILLQPDRELWERVLPGSSQGVVGVNEVLSNPVEIDRAIATLTHAASDCLGVRWQPLSLSGEDWQVIADLSSQFSLPSATRQK